jgi:hypothetical protein
MSPPKQLTDNILLALFRVDVNRLAGRVIAANRLAIANRRSF